MQAKFLEFIVANILKYLDTTIVAKALIGVLRGACGALKDVAARTSSTVDDTVVAALTKIVDEIAVALKV